MPPELLDAAAVERLLPHRPPYRLLDAVLAYAREPQPALRAVRRAAPADPWLAGHFPGLAVVPGAILLEGMAQAAAVLRALGALDRLAAARGVELFASFGDLADEVGRAETLGVLGVLNVPGMLGVLAAANVRFRAPAFPDQPIGYEVTFVRELGDVWRCAAAATQGGAVVASGDVTLARTPRARLRRR